MLEIKATVTGRLRVPMASPDLEARDTAAVNEVLRSTTLSIGPQVAAFESAVAELTGSAHAVAVSSGTAGLHLCVIAAGVEERDLVITTPFSFVASSNVVLYERAIPVFVDVDPLTGNISAALVREAAADLMAGGRRARQWLPATVRDTRVGRLKAILPVHVFGQPADMDPILDVARAYDLRVIEDACEAVGAEYRGRPAGTLGDAGVFAFYPNKQVTTGEGGLIVTGRDDWSALSRSLRNQGRDVFDAWLCHTRLGFNYRLDEMSAALGLSQIARLDELLARRARVAAWYDQLLAELPLLATPQLVPTTTRTSWFVYVIRVRPPLDRDTLMVQLELRGIPSRPYFSPIHRQPFYIERFGYGRGDFPVTDDLGDRSLALPFSGTMTRAQVELVCAALRELADPNARTSGGIDAQCIRVAAST
jgi:perosamine synthetase